MSAARLLAMVAWQFCFWPLPTLASGLPTFGRPEALIRLAPVPGPWRLRLFKLPGPRREDCPCPCLAALPGPGPAAPHWHGAAGGGRRPGQPLKVGRNLVVEVRRIELNDAFGVPRGTFR